MNNYDTCLYQISEYINAHILRADAIIINKIILANQQRWNSRCHTWQNRHVIMVLYIYTAESL